VTFRDSLLDFRVSNRPFSVTKIRSIKVPATSKRVTINTPQSSAISASKQWLASILEIHSALRSNPTVKQLMLSYKYAQREFSTSLKPQLESQVEFHRLEILVLISTYKSLNPTSFTKMSFSTQGGELEYPFWVSKEGS